jgi:hypothetical protein
MFLWFHVTFESLIYLEQEAGINFIHFRGLFIEKKKAYASPLI